jgi:hypothetical protein
MTKAIPRPNTSRRALFTGAAAGVFSAALATAATGAAATPNTGADAELLTACATWHQLTAELMAATEDGDVQAAGERQCAQLHAVSLMPARTPEGIRAKAGVAVRALIAQVGGFGAMPWHQEATGEEVFVIRVLAEVAGVTLA